ncbi:MAG: 50S ribosomal protein L17 [Limnochordia bacterium]|jgi:large subunit ribosomal protein L17|nr:50S ribosomal protein L17 [Limnochordia bacterium]MDI9466008.1 50S ribosomal protein L17 [Bacillota bacterium]NLO95608.1 50S ribosomal protein L17 [Bacillota bacterium]HAI52024.1 50S ribosomal protein L17 [Bacillota bacterium]HAN95889.1 50S ribosomal protein L17 [Bacillota bacterium]
MRRRKLGRTSGHRRALLRNQVTSLVLHGRIETTEAKAKSIKPLADKMVTLGKRGDLAARRQAAAFLLDPAAVRKLFDDLAPRYADRNGGYTRIIKTGVRRGDAAPMAIIEWV